VWHHGRPGHGKALGQTVNEYTLLREHGKRDREAMFLRRWIYNKRPGQPRGIKDYPIFTVRCYETEYAVLLALSRHIEILHSTK